MIRKIPLYFWDDLDLRLGSKGGSQNICCWSGLRFLGAILVGILSNRYHYIHGYPDFSLYPDYQ